MSGGLEGTLMGYPYNLQGIQIAHLAIKCSLNALLLQSFATAGLNYCCIRIKEGGRHLDNDSDVVGSCAPQIIRLESVCNHHSTIFFIDSKILCLHGRDQHDMSPQVLNKTKGL